MKLEDFAIILTVMLIMQLAFWVQRWLQTRKNADEAIKETPSKPWRVALIKARARAEKQAIDKRASEEAKGTHANS